MKRGNLISGILLLLLAVAVWAGSSAFPPESSFFPRALAVIMALLTLLMLAESHLDAQDEAVFDQGASAYKRTILVLVLTVAYSYLLGYFGFLALTPISLFALMRIMEKGNSRWKIAASVLTTACIYLVFQMMLDVPLPAWSL